MSCAQCKDIWFPLPMYIITIRGNAPLFSSRVLDACPDVTGDLIRPNTRKKKKRKEN